jgi:hypothetical protein
VNDSAALPLASKNSLWMRRARLIWLSASDDSPSENPSCEASAIRPPGFCVTKGVRFFATNSSMTPRLPKKSLKSLSATPRSSGEVAAGAKGNRPAMACWQTGATLRAQAITAVRSI